MTKQYSAYSVADTAEYALECLWIFSSSSNASIIFSVSYIVDPT